MTRFSKINRKDAADYNPHYQRHHLIPLQAASISGVRKPLDEMISGGFDFDNFETNGVLLPSDERVALKTGRALHRGPHPRYNELVITRLLLIIELSGQIENSIKRCAFFRMRMALLQLVLRRTLLNATLPILRLHKRDPGLSSSAFRELDDCVDALYRTTQWPRLKPYHK